MSGEANSNLARDLFDLQVDDQLSGVCHWVSGVLGGSSTLFLTYLSPTYS